MKEFRDKVEPVKILHPPDGITEAPPGVVQLEEDSNAPLQTPEWMLALSLNDLGKATAELTELRRQITLFSTVATALVRMIAPATDNVIIPAEVCDRVEGMQIEVSGFGPDVMVRLVSRAPKPIVATGGKLHE